MRLLFAVLFLLNIAYHDTCGGGGGGPATPKPPGPRVKRIVLNGGLGGYGGMGEAIGRGYGHMGMMGNLGQMGQMMKRNGNVFPMLPIKKNGKMWEFCQNSARWVYQ